MGDVGHTEPGPPLDEELLWYFDAVCKGRTHAYERVLLEPRLPPTAITGILDEVRDHDGEVPAWAALSAAENPSSPADVLRGWVTGPDVITHVRTLAAANPQLGPDAEALYPEFADIAEWFLANPAADPDFINLRYRYAPQRAFANPLLDPDIVNAHHLLVPEALTHPGIDPDIRRSALAGNNEPRRITAVRNPNTTLEEVAAAVDEWRQEDPSGLAVKVGQHILDRASWSDDPFRCPAQWLTEAPQHPGVHTALRNLEPAALDALRAVLHAGFDGTVAELLDVADTFR